MKQNLLFFIILTLSLFILKAAIDNGKTFENIKKNAAKLSGEIKEASKQFDEIKLEMQKTQDEIAKLKPEEESKREELALKAVALELAYNVGKAVLDASKENIDAIQEVKI